MNPESLGFDAWFQNKRNELQRPDCEVARVTRVDRDRYLVRNGDRDVQGEATGKLLFGTESPEDLPCVGDWTLVQFHNDGALAIIHELLPRKTFLRRRSPGKNVNFQMIASNIDTAFIVQACDADFNLRRMERYLVIARDGGVEPVILLSKSDLLSPDEINGRVSDIRRAKIASQVIPLSNLTSDGTEGLRRVLVKGRTYCLLGSSGVGKTTLMNHLIGQELFETNPVREKDGRGKHTTARRQLIVLDNGALLVDTPGMRELGMMGVEAGIEDSFADIHELSQECRFNDCTHTAETGCAILAAVETGSLTEERYRSYLKLMKESAFHQMSYVERRRREKRFGRMAKSVLKNGRKK
ncbi:MAG TPA: ribosome small subunit-dependent GTPase A [Bacteroidota bacterium]|nr:ribosome small subunit-dependent GTPase A [Bacteroidota bacterium]